MNSKDARLRDPPRYTVLKLQKAESRENLKSNKTEVTFLNSLQWSGRQYCLDGNIP